MNRLLQQALNLGEGLVAFRTRLIVEEERPGQVKKARCEGGTSLRKLSKELELRSTPAILLRIIAGRTESRHQLCGVEMSQVSCSMRTS